MSIFFNTFDEEHEEKRSTDVLINTTVSDYDGSITVTDKSILRKFREHEEECCHCKHCTCGKHDK